MKNLFANVFIFTNLISVPLYAEDDFLFAGSPEQFVDEVVNPQTGELYIETRDITLPGNGGMNIDIYRSFAKQPNVFFTYMRNWELEIPRVVVPANQYGQTVGGSPGNAGLCEDPRPVNVIEKQLWETFGSTNYAYGPLAPSLTVSHSGQWSLIFTETGIGFKGKEMGIQLVIPGQPIRTLVPIKAGVAEYPSTVRYASEDHWTAECYASSNTQNRKDGFKVRSPDGTVYIMDQIGRSHGDHNWQTFGALGHNAAYTSQIVDINGNSIHYEYQVQRQIKADPTNGAITSSYYAIPSSVIPTRIYANDGREITLEYNEVDTSAYQYLQDQVYFEPPVSRIQTNTGQVWDYHYTGEKLHSVAGPQGLAWAYEYNGPNIGQRYKTSWISRISYESGHRYNIAHISKMTMPTGASVSYTYQQKNGDFWGGPNANIKVQALSTRSVSGGGLTAGTWTYVLQSDSAYTTLEVQGPNKTKRWQAYKDYNSWQYGRLRSFVTETSSGQQLRDEVYTWRNHRQIGDLTTIGTNGFLPKSVEHRGIISQRVVNGSFTTTYGNPDNFGIARTIGESGTASRTATRTIFNHTGNWIIGKVEDETVGGLTVDRTFNSKGQLTRINEYGVTTDFQYHATGDLKKRIWTKDGATLEARFENYYRGTPQNEYWPDGTTVGRVVNASGTIKSERNSRSFTTGFEYDLLNRLMKVVPPSPHKPTTITWPTFRKKETVKGDYMQIADLDGLGKRLVFTEGHRTDTTKRTYQRYGYDAEGRQTFVSLKSNNSNEVLGVQFDYDGLDRLISEKQLAGTAAKTYITTYCYAPGCGAGLTHGVRITDPRNYNSYLHHRAYGEPEDRLLVKVVEQELSTASGDSQNRDRITDIARNSLGDITSISQGGLNRAFAYVPGTRLVETLVQPETGTTSFTYDEVGNLKTRKVGTSGVTTYHYDALNRQQTIDYTGATTDISYTYDGNGNLESVAAGPIVWNYKYNAIDQLIQENLTLSGGATGVSDSFLLDYLYNGQDDLERIIYPTGRGVVFNPDIFGRPTKAGSAATSVQYHPNSAPKSITFGNQKIQTYELDEHQSVETLKVAGLLDFKYQYDGNANVTDIIDYLDRGNTRTMNYDGLSRLTGMSSSANSYGFQYDATDNLISKTVNGTAHTFQYNTSDNKLQSITNSSYSFGYDAYGNVSSNGTRAFSYDDAGNLIQSGSNSYFYDGNNWKVVGINAAGQHVLSLYSQDGLLRYKENRATGLIEEYLYVGRTLVGVSKICAGGGAMADCGA